MSKIRGLIRLSTFQKYSLLSRNTLHFLEILFTFWKYSSLSGNTLHFRDLLFTSAIYSSLPRFFLFFRYLSTHHILTKKQSDISDCFFEVADSPFKVYDFLNDVVFFGALYRRTGHAFLFFLVHLGSGHAWMAMAFPL